MPETDDPNALYALGVDSGERARLVRQAEEWAPLSRELLDRTGLGPGDTAVDLGCGPAGVLALLHDRVGPQGRVVGVDADEAHVAAAGRFAKERDLGAVELFLGDARNTGLPAASFDVVHVCAVLVNIPQPADVVAEMVRLARPGGWVVALEPDPTHSICHPPIPEYARLGEIFGAVYAARGVDLLVGRGLPELFRSAGLEDVTLECRAPIHPPGHSRRTIQADLLRLLGPQAAELGITDAAEVAAVEAAVRAHLEHPDTVVMPHLSFLAWGRKPA